jgi:hypothetical protein
LSASGKIPLPKPPPLSLSTSKGANSRAPANDHPLADSNPLTPSASSSSRPQRLATVSRELLPESVVSESGRISHSKPPSRSRNISNAANDRPLADPIPPTPSTSRSALPQGSAGTKSPLASSLSASGKIPPPKHPPRSRSTSKGANSRAPADDHPLADPIPLAPSTSSAALPQGSAGTKSPLASSLSASGKIPPPKHPPRSRSTSKGANSRAPAYDRPLADPIPLAPSTSRSALSQGSASTSFPTASSQASR